MKRLPCALLALVLSPGLATADFPFDGWLQKIAGKESGGASESPEPTLAPTSVPQQAVYQPPTILQTGGSPEAIQEPSDGVADKLLGDTRMMAVLGQQRVDAQTAYLQKLIENLQGEKTRLIAQTQACCQGKQAAPQQAQMMATPRPVVVQAPPIAPFQQQAPQQVVASPVQQIPAPVTYAAPPVQQTYQVQQAPQTYTVQVPQPPRTVYQAVQVPQPPQMVTYQVQQPVQQQVRYVQQVVQPQVQMVQAAPARSYCDSMPTTQMVAAPVQQYAQVQQTQQIPLAPLAPVAVGVVRKYCGIRQALSIGRCFRSTFSIGSGQ